MSRIGKLPVHLPAGVTVEVLPGNVVKVKGPLGELSQKVDADITVAIEGTEIKLTRPTDLPRHRSLHGLYRALINNMVVGVSEGYTIRRARRSRLPCGRSGPDAHHVTRLLSRGADPASCRDQG